MTKKTLFEGQQYFEGTLQLRNPSKELLAFVDNAIHKAGNITVAKIVKTKNGLDYFLSSQKFIQSLGKRIQQAYPGELKTSVKLFTRNRQTSKEVYRISVLFRLYNYSKGDIVTYKGEDMEIIGLGAKLKLQNLKSKKKHSIPYSDPYIR